MRLRFSVILLSMVVLIAAWTYIEWQIQILGNIYQEQFTKIPIYVYTSDSVAYHKINSELKNKYNLKVRWQPNNRVIEQLKTELDLKVAEDMIDQASIPNVITIYFTSIFNLFEQRKAVVYELGQIVPATDIEPQESAFKDIEHKLLLIYKMHVPIYVFAGLTILLTIIYQLLLYEQLQERLRKRAQRSVIELLRYKHQFWAHVLELAIVPVGLSAVAYYSAYYLNAIDTYLHWRFFLIQAGVVILALLISMPIVQKMGQMSILQLDDEEEVES